MNRQMNNLSIGSQRGRGGGSFRGGGGPPRGGRGGGNQPRGNQNYGGPATGGKDIDSQVLVNVFPLKLEKNLPFFKYDVKITLNFGEGREKELSTERHDDSRVYCSYIMDYVRRNKDIGFFAYNRAAALYSLKKFEEFTTSLRVTEIPQLEGLYFDCDINVTVKPSSETFQATTNDINSCVPGTPNYQPNLIEVLNILLEKEAFDRPQEWYSRNGIHYLVKDGNQNKSVPLEGGVVLKPGLKTAAAVVGEKGSLRLVVVADIKSVVQHLPQNLAEKLDELKRAGCRNYEEALHGISVAPIYGTRKSPWTIQGVNAAKNISHVIDGQPISNVDYFSKKYNIRLRRNDLPMIGRHSRGDIIWYPAEVLQILPNQSVMKESMFGNHHDQIIKWSAMLPQDRINLTIEFVRRLKLFESENLQNFGFKLGQNFLQLPCTILGGVEINDKPPRSNTDVGIRNQKFYMPPKLSSWAIINYGCQENNFKSFKEWILEVMAEKGFVFPPPKEITITTDLKPQELLEKSKAAGFQFVLIILDDRRELQEGIKYYEQKYQIITQVIKSSVVRKAVERNQSVTVENIMLKTCLKNGGIPYKVENKLGDLRIMTNDVIYMGIEFSHQQSTGGASRRFMKYPSRMGYSATCGFHPNQVIGDFTFVEPHNPDAALDKIAEVVNQCKDAFITKRTKQGAPAKTVPKIMVLYLSGYSEGQWRLLEESLVPKLKKVLSPTKLILVLENKKPMERLYAASAQDRTGTNARDTNVKAGVVLDHTILSPVYKGFYLNPHIILQGTARTPMYTVLFNESNTSLRSIEYATHALCFLHSVCMTPTAEPAVLTVADRCAERGQKVLKIYSREHPGDIITVSEANQQLTNPLSGLCHSVRYNA